MRNARAIDAAFAALADPARRRAIELLSEEPRRAGDLAAALGLPAPSMSRHLKALKEGGLVEEKLAEFDSRVRIYSIKSGALDELKQWLASTEDLWAARLSSFRAHVKNRRR
ncbi:MAG: metalloregulator ArsR/SmtB family transcription factor [Parvularculaceae bacterium]|nr:winged helix-turn-helix transcriptional regulator [Parvularculaceae bacterium]